ncbi:acyl-CoA dehydrogenase family protein [Nocardia sp. NPDC057353]|uniref:acyl-CoA dehydrogenase family protein n=1 Tax=Nocardia sp. NPDC057353 TaxID=3346104 RepID=UPI00363D2918
MPALDVPWPRTEPAALTPSPERQELRDSLRTLLTRHSDIERVRAAAESELGYDRELWRLLATEMSVAAIAVPEHRGGLGYGTAELATVLEECGRALAAAPVLTSAVLGAGALLAADDRDTVHDLLPAVLEGELLATVSPLTGETDRLRAEPGPDGWMLSGTVTGVLGGASAELLIALAACPDGVRLFAARLGPEVARARRTVIDPTRGQADLTMDGTAATALTSPETTAATVERLRDLATLAVACENTGVIDRLLELTVEYTRARQQFGRPIASFQAIKHRLADLLVLLERARSAARYAAAVYADDPGAARLAVAVAGAVCTEAAVQAAAEAVQLHGGVGFTWEHAAHSYYRRALGNEAAHGSATEHRARIAALLGL